MLARFSVTDTLVNDGRGGGITGFTCMFRCKSLVPPSSSSTFEGSLFELGRSHPVMCAIIYNKDVFNDFLNSWQKLKYDQVLF